MESSGSIVNSIAIESVVAYAETVQKWSGAKIAGIDGTWCGGYGSSREGSGFGVDQAQTSKSGKTLWLDRCLPFPDKKNGAQFLAIIKEKVEKHSLAGIYLEPDIAGDLGIFSPDKTVLEKMSAILKKYGVPLILDCIQQLGRTGGYWGENVETIFKDQPLLILTAAKSASNGQPFGYTILPKVISDVAYPISQVTTNQMNGPLLRSLVVAEILKNKQMQSWLEKKSNMIEEIAKKYDIEAGDNGLRGKFLNRGVFVGTDEQVKLVQIALFVEDGILVGALPGAIRYQPMLLELSSTNEYVAHAIFRRITQIKKGVVSKEVQEIYNRLASTPTGLARKNKE